MCVKYRQLVMVLLMWCTWLHAMHPFKDSFYVKSYGRYSI